ncbi:MAG: arylsulfotransferase family protein [Thermodesulfobacteriota bacterium]|nr:arylsulfotransferase family protein [Thermodesulfobacteriota bacterium]
MTGLKWLKIKWDALLFCVCFFFLSMIIVFGYGFYTAKSNAPPYHTICETSNAVIKKYGLQLAQLIYKEKHKKYPYLWYPATETQSGVSIYKKKKTYNGYTFFSDCTSSAYLINMQGDIVHKWHKSFYDVWPEPAHVKPYVKPLPEDLIFWHKAHLFPNGDVIAIYEGAFSPYGAGIIKIDKSSNLIWKNAVNAHHDLDIAKDGRIFVLTHKYNKKAKVDRIDDYITILSLDGDVLDNISLYDAIKESYYKYLIPAHPFGDYLHTNNIELLTKDKANGFDFLNAGDILLSHLGIGGITVLDGKTFKVKWALTGLSEILHDADFLNDGRLVFFNNLMSHQGRPVGSEIVEWDTAMRKVVWTFTSFDYLNGNFHNYFDNDIFSSMIYGSQQKLPNANYLVTESAGGTLFEITPEKEVVWKYVTTNSDGKSISSLHWAQRYAEDALSFLRGNGDLGKESGKII